MNNGYFCHQCNILYPIDNVVRCVACDSEFLEIMEIENIEEVAGYQNVANNTGSGNEEAMEGNNMATNNVLNGYFPEVQIEQAEFVQEMQCRICREILELGENVRQINCGHLGHENCIANNPIDYCLECDQMLDDNADSDADEDVENNGINMEDDDDSVDGGVDISIEDFTLVEINENQEVECTVCLADFNPGENARELPCGHKFHEPCLRQWIDEHVTCPTCRERIDTQINNDDDDYSDSTIDDDYNDDDYSDND